MADKIVKLAAVITVIALILKTAVGYTLIFGHFGFPALGVRGAAIGTAVGIIAASLFTPMNLTRMVMLPLAMVLPTKLVHSTRCLVASLMRNTAP